MAEVILPVPFANRKLERKKKKAKKDFYRTGWTKAYNDATKKFNSEINNINDKYKDVSINENGVYDTLRGYEYVQEVNKMWTSQYSDAIIKKYGDIGKDFIIDAPFMDNYSPEYWVDVSILEKYGR